MCILVSKGEERVLEPIFCSHQKMVLHTHTHTGILPRLKKKIQSLEKWMKLKPGINKVDMGILNHSKNFILFFCYIIPLEIQPTPIRSLQKWEERFHLREASFYYFLGGKVIFLLPILKSSNSRSKNKNLGIITMRTILQAEGNGIPDAGQ